MEQVISILYGASGIAATALYLPQILRYRRDPESRRSISLLAWGGWMLIALVTILYALVVVHSPLFAGVAALNIAAQSVVVMYGVSARMGASPATTASR